MAWWSDLEKVPLFAPQFEKQDDSLIATAVSSAQNCVSLGLGHGAFGRSLVSGFAKPWLSILNWSSFRRF